MEWFIIWILVWLIEWFVESYMQWPTEWLKEWMNPIVISGVLSGIATFIIAFITMKSVSLTERNLNITERLAESTEQYVHLTEGLVKAANKPEIVVSIRPDELNFYLLMLHIENVGTGTAYNVEFKTDFSRKLDMERTLGEIHFLKFGLPNFESGLKIPHFLLSVLEKGNYEKQKQKLLKVEVTYQDSAGHDYNGTFDLDFGMWEGLARAGSPPSVKMANALDGIQKSLNNFMTSRKPPIVLTGRLSEHYLLGKEKILLSRMRYLPYEVQQELLQELSIAVAQKERENPKANRNSFFEKHTSRYNVT